MAYTPTYTSTDLPAIFIDVVALIGVAIVNNIALLVGGIILAMIIGIYLGLPQKAMHWIKSFSKH